MRHGVLGCLILLMAIGCGGPVKEGCPIDPAIQEYLELEVFVGFCLDGYEGRGHRNVCEAVEVALIEFDEQPVDIRSPWFRLDEAVENNCYCDDVDETPSLPPLCLGVQNALDDLIWSCG